MQRQLLFGRGERPGNLQPPLLAKYEAHLARRSQAFRPVRAERSARPGARHRAEQLVVKVTVLAARLRVRPSARHLAPSWVLPLVVSAGSLQPARASKRIRSRRDGPNLGKRRIFRALERTCKYRAFTRISALLAAIWTLLEIPTWDFWLLDNHFFQTPLGRVIALAEGAHQAQRVPASPDESEATGVPPAQGTRGAPPPRRGTPCGPQPQRAADGSTTQRAVKQPTTPAHPAEAAHPRRTQPMQPTTPAQEPGRRNPSAPVSLGAHDRSAGTPIS